MDAHLVGRDSWWFYSQQEGHINLITNKFSILNKICLQRTKSQHFKFMFKPIIFTSHLP